MNKKTINTEVVIIGGGPVGLGMSLELRYQGIDCIVVDENDGIIAHPKVGTVGPRSMEIFRRWGISQDVRDAGWPYDHPIDVAWVTALCGHEIYRLKFGDTASRGLPAYTPEPEHPCPQHWLIPLMLKNLGVYPQGLVRLKCHMDNFQQGENGVTVQVTHLDSGERETITAKYMVACDGARAPVRKACGVDAPAYHPTRVFQNILFQAPELPKILGSRKALVFFLVTPKTLRYPLRSMDGKGLYRLTATPHENGESRDPEAAVREALGVDTPFKILSSIQWHLTHRVAEHFRHGNIFFVGDSAHTLSPSGGFGMNTGIADALDLGWKLAGTLKGWAGSDLLDTYELERRPIAVQNMEEANVNLQRTLKRKLPEEIISDSPAGEQARQQMAEKLESQNVRQEFDAPGVHLGLRYSSPNIISDGVPPTNDPHQWTQSSYPGCRAPHAWLKSGLSTLDLFGRSFVLMLFNSKLNIEKLEKVCEEKQVPLTTHYIGNPEIARLYECALVLVRPDGHVAWRGDTLPDDLGKLIDRVRGKFSS